MEDMELEKLIADKFLKQSARDSELISLLENQVIKYQKKIACMEGLISTLREKVDAGHTRAFSLLAAGMVSPDTIAYFATGVIPRIDESFECALARVMSEKQLIVMRRGPNMPDPGEETFMEHDADALHVLLTEHVRCDAARISDICATLRSDPKGGIVTEDRLKKLVRKGIVSENAQKLLSIATHKGLKLVQKRLSRKTGCL